MSNATSMSSPVRRDELLQEWGRLREELVQNVSQELAHLAAHVELAILNGVLVLRFEPQERRLVERLIECMDRSQQPAQAASFEQRLQAERRPSVRPARRGAALERLVRSIASRISIIDGKYKDLPERVKRIETAVFTPTPR